MKKSIDEILKAVDDFLKDNKIQLLIELPEGTMDAKIKDNAGGFGAAVQLYILMHVFVSAFNDMITEMHIDSADKEAVFDVLTKMIKEEALKEK